jgi:hypothetical protein
VVIQMHSDGAGPAGSYGPLGSYAIVRRLGKAELHDGASRLQRRRDAARVPRYPERKERFP